MKLSDLKSAALAASVIDHNENPSWYKASDFAPDVFLKNARFIAAANPATVLKLIRVVEAAQNLVAVKGRHHSEQAYERLEAALKELE